MLSPYFNIEKTEAGVDEAGRGCYAGPVFAAAVILPKDFYHPLLNDSKKLNEKQRDSLRPIIEKESLAFGVASVDHLEIDQINILQASYKAMHLAIAQLKLKPNLLLIDGNRFKPFKQIEHVCIIKGDGKYASIAAASILAKTYRDELMSNLAKEHPQYAWHRNMGYPTKAHRNAIFETGITPHHRKTFRLLAEDMGGNS